MRSSTSRAPRSGRLLAACVLVVASGSNARAQIDASGPWLTTIFDVAALSEWAQSGSSLTVDLSNFPPLSPEFGGTIDSATGAFSLGGHRYALTPATP
jgi:hypothetical protein